MGKDLISVPTSSTTPLQRCDQRSSVISSEQSARRPHTPLTVPCSRPVTQDLKHAMPRPALPPTPGSSTSFKPKTLDDAALSFAPLPPPAMASEQQPPSPISPSTGQSLSSRRNSSSRDLKGALPPPPTRSRKIIQVKPALQPAPPKSLSGEDGSPPSSKRKMPTPTSAAGRKIARKTAHSLIERRRRSKMNEEFGVLKGMIPACAGIEMHKLAILQVSKQILKPFEANQK
jgi:hypothetical protein